MKFLSTVITVLAMTTVLCWSHMPAYGQTGINYQAVARNSSGDVMQNKSIDVRLTVLDATSSQAYQETHNGVSTNDYGLFTLVLGSQNTSNFNTIDWSNGDHELEVEIDNGNGFTSMGTQALQNVPYSLHADMALGEVNNVSTGGVADGQVLKWNATNSEWEVASDNTGGSGGVNTDATIDGDGANTPLSIAQQGASSGEVLEWDGNSWTPTSISGGGDDWGSQIAQTGTAIEGDGTSGNELDVAQQGASNGEVLKWNGSSWAPGSDNTGGSGGVNTDASIDGDGSNTPLSIAQQGASSGEVLEWDGSSWSPTTISGGSSVWSTSSGDAYYNSGNVGIGTSSPSGRLHITASGTGIDDVIQLTSSQNSSEDWYQYLDGNDDYVIRDDGSDEFTIQDGSGNVGIGNTSPSESLDVSGSINLTGALSVSGNTGTNGQVLTSTGSGLQWQSPSSGSSVWSTSGSDAYYNSGNVGIGTTSPDKPLVVYDNSSAEMIVRNNSGSGELGYKISTQTSASKYAGMDYDPSSFVMDLYNNRSGGHITFSTETGDERMRIEHSSGNVGIGTTSPNEDLVVEDVNGDGTITVQTGDGSGDELEVGSAETLIDGGNNTLEFDNASLEPVTDNNRDLGSSSKRWQDVYAANGVTTTSDKRAKDDIESLQYGLDELMALNPVTYKTRNTHHPVKENSLGLIAQETQSVIDEVVKTHDWEQKEEGGKWVRKELDLYGINYGELVPVLINSVQEQQKIIEEQKKELDKIKSALAEEGIEID